MEVCRVGIQFEGMTQSLQSAFEAESISVVGVERERGQHEKAIGFLPSQPLPLNVLQCSSLFACRIGDGQESLRKPYASTI